MPGGADGRDPVDLFGELEIGPTVETRQQGDGDKEAQREDEVRPQLDCLRLSRGNKEKNEKPDEGGAEYDGEKMIHSLCPAKGSFYPTWDRNGEFGLERR